MFDNIDPSIKVFILLFGTLALFLCAVIYWVAPEVSLWIAQERQRREEVREQKRKFTKALVDVEVAREQRDGWLDRAESFSWNMRGKKLTLRQKSHRDFLRRQGLGYVNEEIDIRKYLYDQKGESHHRSMVKELYLLRDQLADEHQDTWLINFYKS